MQPPWQKFPTYERYTIGWRMGDGEGYRYDWYDFLKTIPADYESRLAYLREHRPAPINWGDSVLQVLNPDQETDEEFGCSEAEIKRLLDLQLIEHDVAYQTWRMQQREEAFPWRFPFGESPEKAARYWMRDFWFFSRRLSECRNAVDIQELPEEWTTLAEPMRSGELGNVDTNKGLSTIAQMLCAGEVLPPWNFGLNPADFADSYEMDMGFCDAFRLWVMCSFDDDKLLRIMLNEGNGIPSDWIDWVDQQATY